MIRPISISTTASCPIARDASGRSRKRRAPLSRTASPGGSSPSRPAVDSRLSTPSTRSGTRDRAPRLGAVALAVAALRLRFVGPILAAIFALGASAPSARAADVAAKPRATAKSVAKTPAAPTAPTVTPASPPAATADAPGACSYVQRGLKVCSTADGQGVFDVATRSPAIVVVTFEDEITGITNPPKAYYHAEYVIGSNVATIRPAETELPATTPIVITTKTVQVTLNLRRAPDAEHVDTQLTVKSPERVADDARIERRVTELLRVREQALADQEDAFEKRSSERASAQLLEDLAAKGAEIRAPGGDGAARNAAHIVLRAKHVVRMGGRRYVVLTLENLDAKTFDIDSVHVWVKDNTGERALKAPWTFAARAVGTNQRVQGAIFLPLDRVSGKTRVRVRVDESDGERGVELGGIEVH